jgi:hypothetical protein
MELGRRHRWEFGPDAVQDKPIAIDRSGGMSRIGTECRHGRNGLPASRRIEIAQEFSDPNRILALLGMARSWLALAELSQKQTGETLMYEMPTPRQHVAQQQQPQPEDPGKTE